MEKSQIVMVNESKEESSPVINREPRKTQLPEATVVAKSVKIPVKIAGESERVRCGFWETLTEFSGRGFVCPAPSGAR